MQGSILTSRGVAQLTQLVAHHNLRSIDFPVVEADPVPAVRVVVGPTEVGGLLFPLRGGVEEGTDEPVGGLGVVVDELHHVREAMCLGDEELQRGKGNK